MKLVVVLDRGHGQKARGARFDPGATAGQVREVDLAQAYMEMALAELVTRGHLVHWLETGTYDERHREAIRFAAAHPDRDGLYVQCHVNAGGGKYGLVEHDHRSRWGRTAAACLADALDELPETPRVHVWDLDPSERGWVCIDDIYTSPTMTAALYEPFFIDSAAHAKLRTTEGLARVGLALAEGVHRYARSCAARKAA